MSEYDWVGTNSRGEPRSGRSTVTDLRDFVLKRYVAGWRTLRVLDRSRPGMAALVGEIFQRDQRRTWWAESTATITISPTN